MGTGELVSVGLGICAEFSLDNKGTTNGLAKGLSLVVKMVGQHGSRCFLARGGVSIRRSGAVLDGYWLGNGCGAH